MPVTATYFPRPVALKDIAVGDVVVRSGAYGDVIAMRVQLGDDPDLVLVLASVSADGTAQAMAPYLDRADTGVHCRIAEPLVARPRVAIPIAMVTDPPNGALAISQDGSPFLRFRLSPDRTHPAYLNLTTGRIEAFEGQRAFYADWDLCRQDEHGETVIVSFPVRRPELARAVA